MKTDPNTIAELRALLEKAPGPSMWQMLPRPFPPRQSEDDTALADAAVNALPDLLDDVEENAHLRAEVEALRQALTTIERTGAPGGSIAAKRTDGHACGWCRGMWTPCPTAAAQAALARLDALRKEKA